MAGKLHDLAYRPDIDGIRGIAVLLVVAFHATPAIASGGFVGVDVFFFISGYLISTIIFHDLDVGRFSLARFYSRRVKRIFPALAAVLFAVLALGWLVLFGSEFQSLGKHVLAGAAFISNLLLWRENGYFDAAAELKPLLHLWSLGIEEQFYIFFPLGIWLLRRVLPAHTTLVLGVALAVSFGLCLYGTHVRPVATFYLPVTRIWELLVGCSLASIQRDRNCPQGQEQLPQYFARFAGVSAYPLLRNCASLVALTMMLAAAFSLTARNSFPGAWALVPTFGTAVLIASGANSFANRHVLGNRFLVGVGLISYPLYLWHWPALFFARLLSSEKISNFAIATAVAISFLLAWLTFRFIERPVRFRRILGNRTVFVLCSAIGGLSFVGLLAMSKVLPSRLALGPHANEIDQAIHDWRYPFVNNFQRASGFQIVTAGHENATGTAVMFIGDSMMEQYWPRIELIRNALQEHSRPMYFITAGGSPSLPNVNNIAPGYNDYEFYKFCLREAAKPEVGTVVFCCYWEGYFAGKNNLDLSGGLYRIGDTQKTRLQVGDIAAQEVFDEFGKDVGKLVSRGKEVFVILCGASSRTWSPLRQARLSWVSSRADRLPVSKDKMESLVGPIEEQITRVVIANGGHIINPRVFMEEDGVFYGRTVDGKFRYKDNHHMRPFYVEETASFLDALLRSAESH